MTQRVGTIEPKAPGTRETIKLQYGPFTLAPGADASWPQVDVGGAEGYMVSAQPSIRFADGTEVGHNDGVHLHHAHLFRRDQDTAGQTDGRTGYQWIFGTGDEQTLGSFEALSKGDPSGKRYGVKLHREPMLMVWMPMNMTDQAKVVYLEFKFEFIHGSPEAVEKATGEPIRPLQPVLYGETFNVPKTGGFFAWPLDAKLEPEDALGNSEADPEQFMTGDPARTGSVKPGVGHIWTAPTDGELVGAAGHGHEGLMNVTFSNLGSEASPCGNADGDRFPGTKVLESRAFYPPGPVPHPHEDGHQPDRLAGEGAQGRPDRDQRRVRHAQVRLARPDERGGHVLRRERHGLRLRALQPAPGERAGRHARGGGRLRARPAPARRVGGRPLPPHERRLRGRRVQRLRRGAGAARAAHQHGQHRRLHVLAGRPLPRLDHDRPPGADLTAARRW